jgi:hypothetical protein
MDFVLTPRSPAPCSFNFPLHPCSHSFHKKQVRTDGQAGNERLKPLLHIIAALGPTW